MLHVPQSYLILSTHVLSTHWLAIQALVEYRKENQRAIDRTEFDLNDPDAKKKALPARLDDKDPRLTVSGMQLFKGEDLSCEDRVKLQQEQMRSVHQL